MSTSSPQNVSKEDDSQKPILSTSDEENSPKRTVKRKNGWTWLLGLSALVTTLGSSIPVGFNIGVVNTPAQIIKQFCNETVLQTYGNQLSEVELDILWSAVVSVFIVGGVVGSLSGSWIADRFGRKGAIIINNILGVIAAVLFVLSKELSTVEGLILARLIVGVSCGITTSTVPMYLTELSPLELRGAMGVMCPLGVTVGVMLGQIMGLKDVLGVDSTWHYLLALYALPIVLTATALPILPESPKYLVVIKFQDNRATKVFDWSFNLRMFKREHYDPVLQYIAGCITIPVKGRTILELSRIRNVPAHYVEHEVESLRAQRNSSENKEKWTSCRVLKDPKLRLPLLLVCALQGGQQCSGINAVFYYSVSIFESAGLSNANAQYASLGAGAVNLLVAILAVYTMNRFGRRPLALLSCSSAAVCLVLLTVSISLINSTSWMPYVSIAAVLLYVFFYGLGLGPIPYFIGSELFETGPRPVAMSWGSMSNWGGNFIVGMTFPSLQTAIGQYSFMIFVVIVIFLTIFLKCYFPETRDRDQTEIAALLQYGCKSNIHRNVSEQNKREDGFKIQVPLTNQQ